MNAGDVLVGDGGMTFCLERRGYVKAGVWSPECTIESPEAGKNYLNVIPNVSRLLLVPPLFSGKEHVTGSSFVRQETNEGGTRDGFVTCSSFVRQGRAH